MFGYVVANQQELKLKEFGLYRSYYCGFCRELKKKYGVIGELTLSYDMTFLIMLLSDLYDEKDQVSETKCVAHPFEKHPTRINKITDYAADMNLILSYYSCMDDWNDERKIHKLALAKLLERGRKAASVDYGRKAAVVKDRLDKLHAAESAGDTDIDKVSGYFGDIMAELFAVYEDAWEPALRRMGFFLGKFIYIMDAYEDLDKDEKAGSYNPLLPLRKRDDFQEYCHQILTMMMAQCCEAFETLPCVENVVILRNILYSGVWTRYNALQQEKSGTDGQIQSNNASDETTASEKDGQLQTNNASDETSTSETLGPEETGKTGETEYIKDTSAETDTITTGETPAKK